jgi:hypothetical protein
MRTLAGMKTSTLSGPRLPALPTTAIHPFGLFLAIMLHKERERLGMSMHALTQRHRGRHRYTFG